MKPSAALAITAVMLAPAAHADTPDQQFLNMVHANGVGGDDATLVAYGHEFCDMTAGDYPSYPALKSQGVVGYQPYLTIQNAAAMAYCPGKAPTVRPPMRPPIFTGL
jgi:hypothetical protein